MDNMLSFSSAFMIRIIFCFLFTGNGVVYVIWESAFLYPNDEMKEMICSVIVISGESRERGYIISTLSSYFVDICI